MSKSQISTIDDEVKTDALAVEFLSLSSASGMYEILTIHSTQEEIGSEAVPVICNGYPYQIPRDKPIHVPTEVVNVLRDAVTINVRSGVGGLVTETRRPRFAFSSVPA